jgi:hypothetical protein
VYLYSRHFQQAQPAPVKTSTGSSASKTTAQHPIVITNSGSTNTRGYTVTVNPNGSGAMHADVWRLAQQTSDILFPAGTFDYPVLSKNIQSIADFTQSDDRCMKSASFGVAVTVEYMGKTSADLTCPGSTLRQLSDSVSKILEQACSYSSSNPTTAFQCINGL